MCLSDVPQRCPSEVSLRGVPGRCVSVMSLRGVPERSPSEVSLGGVSQWCPSEVSLGVLTQRCLWEVCLSDVPIRGLPQRLTGIAVEHHRHWWPIRIPLIARWRRWSGERPAAQQLHHWMWRRWTTNYIQHRQLTMSTTIYAPRWLKPLRYSRQLPVSYHQTA